MRLFNKLKRKLKSSFQHTKHTKAKFTFIKVIGLSPPEVEAMEKDLKERGLTKFYVINTPLEIHEVDT